MSKIEDRAAKKALETFPILFGERMGYDKTNLQQERRNAYEKGYHQAEKDLEPTLEDVEIIINAFLDLCIENNKQRKTKRYTDEEYCQEVLKRFKERKEK